MRPSALVVPSERLYSSQKGMCVGSHTHQLHRLHNFSNAKDADHSLQVVWEPVKAHLRADVSSLRVRNGVDPIQCFKVPNTCSTVRLRTVIFSGFRFRRRCNASSIFSCSQRCTRRSLPTVHLTRKHTVSMHWSNRRGCSCPSQTWAGAGAGDAPPDTGTRRRAG